MPPQTYVNPSCSKCRTALSLLEEHGVRADTIFYLDHPPTVADLKGLMQLLAIDDPRLMMRTREPLYAELALRRRGGRRPPPGHSPPPHPVGTPHLRRRRPGRHCAPTREGPRARLTIPGAATAVLVMLLFTSSAFSMAFFLPSWSHQLRYNPSLTLSSTA
jgi:hypothetical protein